MSAVEDAPQAEGAAPQWIALRVAGARPIAEDIHEIELRHPDGRALPEFTAGAHLTVRLPGGVIRDYSLCNAPDERERYLIAVKRETAGRGGSIALLESIRIGHLLEALAPASTFALHEGAPYFLFIAGGIGITPIVSMIRHLRAAGRTGFRLYYCTRSPEATAFLEELSAPELRGRVTIHHDGGDPARALDLWPVLERPTGAHIYCCGPRAMMEAVRDMTVHWPRGSVHFESFTDAAPARTAADRAFVVRLARAGTSVEIPADASILHALRLKGYAMPSSCESGTCGVCRMRLVAGEADHRDLVLTDAERTEYIMVCVSRARSTEITIDR